MTDIRELLLEATSDVRIDEPNPVARVRRATNRRQLRLVAATTAVVVAIVGGGVAVDKTTTRIHKMPLVIASGQLESWPGTRNDLATTGFGAAWTINATVGSVLVQRDEGTGAVIGSYNIAPQVQHLAAGAGRIWAYGVKQPAGPGVINVINPATGAVKTLSLHGTNEVPHAIAFADDSAWITFPLVDQVWRLTPTVTGVTKSVIDVPGGPLAVATTGDGQVWVQRAGSDAVEIVPDTVGGHTGQTSAPFVSIFSSVENDELWATGDSPGLERINLDRGGCNGDCAVQILALPTAGTPGAVLETQSGLFISSFYSGSGQGQTPLRGQTTYFSDAALNSSHPVPTATVRSLGMLAADGSGVLIATGSHGIIRWTP
jgi:hypothetical protein